MEEALQKDIVEKESRGLSRQIIMIEKIMMQPRRLQVVQRRKGIKTNLLMKHHDKGGNSMVEKRRPKKSMK